MVQMLLDYGADPNSGYESVWGEEVQEQCYTPYLLLAAMMPNTANIFEALIDRGADIHVKYTKRRGLLDPDARVLEGFEVVWADTLLPNIIESAVRSWHAYGRRWTVDTEVVRKLELLVRHGISIDSEMGGLTPLHYCLLRLRTKTTITMELIPHIIALGADVRSLDPNGSQPLHLLTKHVYTNELENRSAAQSIFLCRTFPPAPSRILMDLMIDNGADPNAVDADGQTPLMHLCRQPAHVHTASLMKALLGRQGIDVNMTDKSGCTALHHIVGEPNAAHHHEICFRLQILLNHSKGVLKVNVRNRSGRTPLHQLLEAQNHDTWGLQRTADLQRRYRVKRRALLMLIRAGADTTARVVPSLQESPLYTWRNGTNDDGLQHVFEPNVGETVDDETLGDTPLHLACREMEPAVMLNLLLRHGAAVYVNSVSRHQRLTPLMMVVGLASAQALPWASMAEAVQVLLDAGADIHLRDSNGRTAWELAMKMCGTSHPWALAPWLEQLMPEMSDEKKQEVLGLGATKRTALGLKKS
jgi:ankyrin repeat protein